MTPTEPTAYEPAPIPATTPGDGDRIAGLDWVLDLTDAHVLAITRDTEPAAMAAAWALGFAGATRLEVWWVLRDERLRRAYGSIIRALTKVRAAVDPSWTDLVAEMAPADRAALAEAAERVMASTPTRVPDEEEALHAACQRHPDAAMSPDRRWVAVPHGALAELAARARSLSPADATALLDRARGPFAVRMDEAARVSGDAATAFHARRAGRDPRVA